MQLLLNVCDSFTYFIKQNDRTNISYTFVQCHRYQDVFINCLNVVFDEDDIIEDKLQI